MIRSTIQAWFRPLRRMSSSVQGNARIIVITEGISNITFQWYSTYLSLYMVALGVDEVTIGWLASVFIVSQLMGTLLGGIFADRYGRKKVVVIGDIFCWGIPLFLFAIAQNPWYFVAGRLINGFIYIVIPSFDCLFVEDVSEDNRPAVFALVQFLYACGSLLAPVAGIIVSMLGMVTAGRIIMLSTAVMVIGIAVVRQFSLKETNFGQENTSNWARSNIISVVNEFTQTFRFITKTKDVRDILILRILVGISNVVWGTYAMIFLTAPEGGNLPKEFIALIPTISAVVTLATVTISAGRMLGSHVRKNLILGEVLWFAGSFAFLFTSIQPLILTCIWAVLNAVSLVLFQPAMLSHWANSVEDHHRAIVFSTATAIITIASLPIGPIAGYSYKLSPLLPFVFSLVLQAFVMWIIVRSILPNTKNIGRK